MDERKHYILWGSAGHAKVLSSLITLCGGTVVALFDNNPDAVSVLPRVPLYIGKDGFTEWFEEENNNRNINGLAAIGGVRGNDRLAVHEIYRAHGVIIESIVHPQTSVCSSASIGSGSQVLAQAVVASDAILGEACIINHHAGVDHECILGDGVHLAPSATLCGCVTIKNNVMIGAGAIVLPRVEIGENTLIGAGAVVTKNIPPESVAIGNPARVIRNYDSN